MKWYKKDIEILKSLYPDRSNSLQDIAKILNRTVIAIKSKATKLQITRNYHANWTPEMITILRDLYPMTNARIIADKLGVSYNSVLNKAYNLNIKKNLNLNACKDTTCNVIAHIQDLKKDTRQKTKGVK